METGGPGKCTGMLTRQALVTEARTWLGTPYHIQACVKGAGVDCARLLEGIAKALGLLPPDVTPPYYSPQWNLHTREETLLNGLRASGMMIEIPLGALALADIVCFAWRGRQVSHVGIVSCETPWRFIHAQQGARVVEVGLAGSWRAALRTAFQWRGVRG